MQPNVLLIEQYQRSLQEADKSSYLNWTYNFTLVSVAVGAIEVLFSCLFLAVLKSPLTFTLTGVSIPAEIFVVWFLFWLKKRLTSQSDNDDLSASNFTFLLPALLIVARLMVFFGIWGHYNWVNDYLDVIASDPSDWANFFPGRNLMKMKVYSNIGLYVLGGINIVSCFYYILASMTVHQYLQDKAQAMRIYSNVLSVFAMVMCVVAVNFLKDGMEWLKPTSVHVDFPKWVLVFQRAGVMLSIFICFAAIVANITRWKIYYLGLGAMSCIFMIGFIVVSGFGYYHTFIFQNQYAGPGCVQILDFTHQDDLIGYGCLHKYVNTTLENCPVAQRTDMWEINRNMTGCLNMHCCQPVSDLYTEIYISIADDTLTISLILAPITFCLIWFLFNTEEPRETDKERIKNALQWPMGVLLLVLSLCLFMHIPNITTKY